VWEVIQEKGLKFLAESYSDVHKAMTFATDEHRDFHRFLDKFRILDEIEWDEGLIDRSVKAVCDELEKENIDYTWMDFSINKYMNIGWHKTEAIKFFYDCFEKYRPGGVKLILSLKYESTRTSQKQYTKLIEDADTAEMLFGIDLVGDEAYFDASFYKSIFQDWVKAGKLIRAHVGESQSAENIKDAIEILGVSNIAHGIKIFDIPGLVDLALGHNICFDLAISSNYYTGVIQDVKSHPIKKMLQEGLAVTLGSDDPIQCNTTLGREIKLAREIGITDEDLDKMGETALKITRP
jgi:adenosine deaminase